MTKELPTLAPPGAGLPKIELWIGRGLFALRRWTGTRQSFQAEFARERQRIAELVRELTPGDGSRRILISRPPGLEDSSRFWSVGMTLDHLRIVHHEFARVIGDLARGVMPAGTASTAAVKPCEDVGLEVYPEYEASCDKLSSVIDAAPDLNSTLRYPHPWFGPLNAAGWHALTGTHLRIHRVQIERILQGVRTSLK